ncbi:MAG TPA: hypothetical protein VF753_16890 [Terriglobales bacterium]
MSFYEPNDPTEISDADRDTWGLPTVAEERVMQKEHLAAAQQQYQEDREKPRGSLNKTHFDGDEDPRSPQQIREEYETAQHKVDATNTERQNAVNADFLTAEFLRATPDYVPCDQNGKLMLSILGDTPPSHSDMDEAWRIAKATGRAKVRIIPTVPSRQATATALNTVSEDF